MLKQSTLKVKKRDRLFLVEVIRGVVASNTGIRS